MPSPIDLLLDPVTLIILGMYAALMLWEFLFPGRKLPKIRFWKIRGIISFVIFFLISSYLPMFIAPYIEPYRLFDFSNLSPIVGGIAGIIIYDFGMYLWHWSLHKSNFLWKTFHQLHHSAERIDTFGAFYFSPFDMVGWTLLSTLCFSFIAGFSPQAITVLLLISNFQSIFQHANIRTPRWIGYIVQRPESHTYHHARGIHKFNYSDLPLFDIIFGTFYNPREFEFETGFYNGASNRVVEMLLAKDVSEPEEAELSNAATLESR